MKAADDDLSLLYVARVTVSIGCSWVELSCHCVPDRLNNDVITEYVIGTRDSGLGAYLG